MGGCGRRRRPAAARRHGRRRVGRTVDSVGARGPDRRDRACLDGIAGLGRTGEAQAHRCSDRGPRPRARGRRRAGGSHRVVRWRKDAVHRVGGRCVRDPFLGHRLGVRHAPATSQVALDVGGTPDDGRRGAASRLRHGDGRVGARGSGTDVGAIARRARLPGGVRVPDRFCGLRVPASARDARPRRELRVREPGGGRLPRVGAGS